MKARELSSLNINCNKKKEKNIQEMIKDDHINKYIYGNFTTESDVFHVSNIRIFPLLIPIRKTVQYKNNN